MSRVAVIGAGAWGTALSIVLGRKGIHQVHLWAHEQEVQDAIAGSRENKKFLPGYRIPETVTPTNDLRVTLEGAEIVVSVMPSHHCRGLFEQLVAHIDANTLLVSATKGLENDSLMRMSEVISEVVSTGRGFRPRIGALSGKLQCELGGLRTRARRLARCGQPQRKGHLFGWIAVAHMCRLRPTDAAGLR